MSAIFNVTFISDDIVITSSLNTESELTDARIARIVGENLESNYGFNPLDFCYSYEIEEV